MTDLLFPKGKTAVRMLCHGLGDCFLVAIAGEERPQYIVVDCGIIVGNPDGAARTKEIVNALRESCGGHADRLIVTNEHWDHVSGFTDAAEEWERFDRIDELWFAWTENPSDAYAIELRASREKALEVALKAFGQCQTDAQDQIAQVLGFSGYDRADLDKGKALEAADAVKKTRMAMEAVKALVKRKGGKIRYWEPGNVESLSGGVQYVVFGPPKDIENLKDSYPSKKNPEVYSLLSASAMVQGLESALDPKARMSTLPLDPCYHIPKDEFLKGENPALISFTELREHYTSDANAWRRVDDAWLAGVQYLAMDLDGDTNNTSLTFALYVPNEDASLVFAGDAQVGNWLSWGCQDYTLATKDGSSTTFKIDALLGRAAFYKTGHHGSRNATMRERGLQLMTDHRLTVMIPVDVFVAHEKKKWKEMPFPKLIECLKERACDRVVQLDAKEVAPPFESGPHSNTLGRALYIDLNPVV